MVFRKSSFLIFDLFYVVLLVLIGMDKIIFATSVLSA